MIILCSQAWRRGGTPYGFGLPPFLLLTSPVAYGDDDNTPTPIMVILPQNCWVGKNNVSDPPPPPPLLAELLFSSLLCSARQFAICPPPPQANTLAPSLNVVQKLHSAI